MLESNASSARSKRKLNLGVWQLGMIEDLISWKVELIYSSHGIFKAHHYFNYILLSENWSIFFTNTLLPAYDSIYVQSSDLASTKFLKFYAISQYIIILRTFLFQIIIFITNPWLKEVWFDYALEGLQFFLPLLLAFSRYFIFSECWMGSIYSLW